MEKSPKVCVIGAGIVGVSTAVCIQDRLPNVEVTIMAAEFSPNLTSDVAAGHIEPYLLPEEDPQKIKNWCRQTMQHCRNYMEEEPGNGAQEISGYFFQNTDSNIPIWWDVVSNFRRLSEKEIAEKHPLPQKAGFFFTTLYMQPTKHISWLMEKFLKRGGKMIQRRLENFADVGHGWDVIVNCSGIGARQLAGDEQLVPVRGQVMRVRAPHVKHFFADDDYYTLVNDDCIILGGTADKGQWDLSVNEETARKIFEGNCKVNPSLKGVEILSHHVGLRPCRHKIRLEAKELKIGDKPVSVVHNYGHGGSGITLGWGTALDAAKIVEEQLGKPKL